MKDTKQVKINEKNGKVTSEPVVFKCEIAFPYLLEPAELNNKYGVTMVFPEQSPELAKASAIIDEVSMRFCGHVDAKNPHPRIKQYKDKFQISATSSLSVGRPRVVNLAKQPMSEEEIAPISGGSICNVAVSFAGYKYLGKKGVTCYLQAVQVIEARDRTRDYFDDLSEEDSFPSSDSVMHLL